MNKKRFFFTFSLLFVLIFLGGFSTSCNAVTIDDYELTDEIMQDIVDELGLGSYYSGDFIPNLTNNFNTIMRTVRARGDYHQVTLADVMILGPYTSFNSTDGKYLQVMFFNWREGYNNDDSTLETFTPYIAFNGNTDGQTITGQKQIYKWDGWTYDNANNITGVTTVSQFQFWRFSNTSITNPTTSLTVHQPTFHIRNTEVGMNKAIIFDNYRNDQDGFVQIASRTTANGYGFYLWGYNIFYLEDYGTTPVPTPTPTGGGGGTVISGGMTQQEFEQGQENYWGNSGDLNGVDQEDDISDSIDNLVQSASGELYQNEIFGALSDFEQGFFNLFVERNPLLLDLKVSWPNIYSLADGNEEFLIESGEINFSEMCRNNETLGNIQDVVRVIFNFYFGVSLLVYLYNLVLSTLGIDNPFLYDNPENGYEDIVYDINTGTETSYVHKTYPNSFRRHQTLIWRRK